MNAALLKQAREALAEQIDLMQDVIEGNYMPDSFTLQPVEAALDALTAFDSLSEYDKALHVIAPYLPDGWVAQDEDGYMSHDSVMPSPCQHGGGDWKTPPRVNAVSYRLSCLRIPRCPDWRSSLRRITHNSDGTVTVERG